MGDLAIIASMLGCAFLPFAVLVKLVRAGASGLALTFMSVLGGVFVVLIYASGRPFGVDPVFALSAALLFVFPALLGGAAGALLGWLLRRRDDQKLS